MRPSTDQCIKCSICNAYCPVLHATALFPGPKLSGPDANRFRQERQFIPSDWLELCDYCKICEMVCPYNVPISSLHIQSRKAWRKNRRPRLRDYLLANPDLTGKLGNWASPITNFLIRSAFFRWLLDRGLGIHPRVAIPFYPKETFLKWFHNRKATTGPGNQVAYFHGCYTNYVDPEVGKALVFVLQKNGLQVIIPKQECCGLPLIANGYIELAAKLARKNLKTLGQATEKNVDIIFSSPSCGMTLKQEYGSILNLPGASEIAGRIIDISQFLIRLHEEGKLNTHFRPIEETIYYHIPCHLRALQIGFPALELLSLIPSLRIIELPENCCGLAGTYGFKKDKYNIASEIGKETFRAIRELGAKKVVSDCEACRMQIANHTEVEVMHPVQILERAYGE